MKFTVTLLEGKGRAQLGKASTLCKVPSAAFDLEFRQSIGIDGGPRREATSRAFVGAGDEHDTHMAWCAPCFRRRAPDGIPADLARPTKW